MANKQQDPVMQAAAEWWVCLREPQAGDEAIEQWLAWTAEDERHLQAFEQVNAFAARLGALDQVSRAQLVRAFARPAPARPRWLPLVAAASVALAVLTGVAYMGWMKFAAGVASMQIYQTRVGQHRDLVLPDGTKVALGAASSLAVQYGNDRRRVELRGGEAYFDVVHDAHRPFVVSVGKLAVRDIGTAFDIRRTGGHVTVAVTQGRVAIDAVPAGGGGNNTLEASAGQRVSYDPELTGMTVDIIAPSQATAWRNDRLEFIDEPLSVVVANLNRYASKPLQIADANLGKLSYTGSVRTDAIDSWVAALPQVFPLQVSREPGRVVLSAASPRQR